MLTTKYKKHHRLLSLLLVVAVVIGLIPAVLADNEDSMAESTTEVSEETSAESAAEPETTAMDGQPLTRSEMLQWTRSAKATMTKGTCVDFAEFCCPTWYCNKYYTSGGHVYGHYFYSSTIAYHYIDGELSYCIEPNVTSYANQTYSGYESSEASSDSYWMEELDATQRKYIQYILAFGYPDVDYGYSEQVQYAATQVLIWEVIMKARYTDIYATNNSGLYNKVAAVLGGDFKTVYKEIVNSISIYEGVFPSFASESASSAPTVKLTLNSSTNCYEGTVTDANGVLDRYTFSQDGSYFHQ